MSGGSWGYLYSQIYDAYMRLNDSKNPLRKQLAPIFNDLSTVLFKIEWADSGDIDHLESDKAIKKFLKKRYDADKFVLEELEAILKSCKQYKRSKS